MPFVRAERGKMLQWNVLAAYTLCSICTAYICMDMCSQDWRTPPYTYIKFKIGIDQEQMEIEFENICRKYQTRIFSNVIIFYKYYLSFTQCVVVVRQPSIFCRQSTKTNLNCKEIIVVYLTASEIYRLSINDRFKTSSGVCVCVQLIILCMMLESAWVCCENEREVGKLSQRVAYRWQSSIYPASNLGHGHLCSNVSFGLPEKKGNFKVHLRKKRSSPYACKFEAMHWVILSWKFFGRFIYKVDSKILFNIFKTF